VPAAAVGLAGLWRAPVLWTAVSRVAAAEVAGRLPGEHEVHVLPNAVEVGPRAATPTRADDAPVRLVSTMRIARRKRPLPLLRMLDTLRRTTATPVHLTLVGDGPRRGRVEQWIQRHDAADLVTLTGRREPAEVLDLLAESDAYVAPALLESFGLAALEARCVGLPVVGLAASGLTEFVTDGVEGWLAGSDARLVDRLRDVVEDPRLRRRVSEHNRLTPSELTWPHALVRTDAAYARAGALPVPRRLGVVQR
jgi:glycosyltransferase involved in cell wall biosynthesis